jgi:hypothetical protein
MKSKGDQIVAMLREWGFAAFVEYPRYIEVVLADGTSANFRKIDDFWAGDVQNSLGDMPIDAGMQRLSTESDADTVAKAIAKTVIVHVTKGDIEANFPTVKSWRDLHEVCDPNTYVETLWVISRDLCNEAIEEINDWMKGKA